MGTLNRIMVGGSEVACDATVVIDPRYQFPALGRRTETRAVVLHWTGGRGLASQVHRTLVQRNLSVHFCIDPDGGVYQYADAALRCSHAGLANAWSIGIEIVNPATPGSTGELVPRALETETIHGLRAKHSAFTGAQVAAALTLTSACCKAYGLPVRSPDHAGVLSLAELAGFRGVLGHLHISQHKRDPGLSILRAVNEYRG